KAVATETLTKYDQAIRDDLRRRHVDFDLELAGNSVRFVVERLFLQVDEKNAWRTAPSKRERDEIINDLVASQRQDFLSPLPYTTNQIIDQVLKDLASRKTLKISAGKVLAPTRRGRVLGGFWQTLGRESDDYHESTFKALETWR